VRVTRCGNADCNAGNVSTTVDDPIEVVGYCVSMAIGADGLPIISHYAPNAGALRVMRCGTIFTVRAATSVRRLTMW
jgi:hypothetical protein